MTTCAIAPLCVGPFVLHPTFDGHRFLGIGAVLHCGTLLRSDLLPWTFYAESETGLRFSHFELDRIETLDKGAAALCFHSIGEWLPRIQEADAMGEARIRTRRVARSVAGFRWIFRPIREQVWENNYDGLAMQLQVSSPGHPLHWILEDTTWEIDGEATGTHLIQQDISTIDLEQEVRADSAFSTIEKFHTQGWGGAYPMDMLPRAAGAAICDFQTKGNHALCLFAERPSLTRARIEKFADENLIHYTDRAYFPLTENARPPERKLLVYRHPTQLKRHEWRNLWLDCFTEVRRRILSHFDFTPDIPLPAIHSYLWDSNLKRLGANWPDALRQAMPEFQKLGYKQVIVHGVWESITSDPAPPEEGNICCPYEFKFAEAFGGVAAMRRLAQAASAAGINIYQWFSFHLSRHAPVWKDHPDWLMKEANGDPWDANYRVLWAGRFRSEYAQWMEQSITDTCRTAAIPGIFWDSYQNLGITCVDWSAPDKAPQAEEIWRFQSRLQKLGISQRCEIITPFGVSQVSIYGFEQDMFRRRLWADTMRNDDIFALIDTSPCFFSESYPFTTDKISPDLYFWMVGHRIVPIIGACPWRPALPVEPEQQNPLFPGGELAEDYAVINHLYLEALPHMTRLRLVEGGSHTLWLDTEGRPAVLWVFKPAQIVWTGPARELTSGRSIVAVGCLDLAAGELWLLGPR